MSQESSPLILTIDVGTSSTRAILFDAQARPLPGHVAQRTNRLETTADGGAVFDAGHLLENVVAVIDQILDGAGPLAHQIGAVAMDTLVGNLVGLDAQGKPVTPVFIYADTRNAADTQALRQELGPEGMAASHNRTGCLIHTSYLPARFRWIQRTHPEWLQAARHWTGIGEYILQEFLGQRCMSYSVASWSGLLNRFELTWDAEWLDRLPIREEQLFPLGDIDQPLQGLRAPWAERWPALRQVAWLPAIGDGAAANIGSGCDDPAHIALTIGSTGAMRVVVDPGLERVPEGLWLYRVDRRRALLGGATTEGGNLFAWLRQTLQLPEPGELEAALAGRVRRQDASGRAVDHGLTVLPFVAGERAPGWREDARASLVGFTLHTDPIDIVQAGLEGIAYRFALIYRRILPHLGEWRNDHQIIASGGAVLSSPAWLQILADALGKPVLTLVEKESTSRGLALLALEQLGCIRRPSALPPETGATYLPDPLHHARHQEGIARQEALYAKLVASRSGAFHGGS